MFQELIPPKVNFGKGAWAVFDGQPYVQKCIAAVFRAEEKKFAEEYVASALSLDGTRQLHLCEMGLKLATGWLRYEVFDRDKFACVKCGTSVVWKRDNPKSGNLHEKVPLGSGGFRTKGNCECLCNDCHTGRRGEHRIARGHKKSTDRSRLARFGLHTALSVL